MKLLFIGDIVGSPGRQIVADRLADIVQTRQIDLVIANGENAASGFGISPRLADELFETGIEVLTGGNHIWDRKEILDYFPNHPRLLRPANFADINPGSGLYVGTARNGVPYAVLNLQGRVFMASNDCPFRAADREIALPGGTAFQTDAGMTGPHNGVIGMDKTAILRRFLDGQPARFEVATGDVQMNAVLIDVDETTGRARAIERLRFRAD